MNKMDFLNSEQLSILDSIVRVVQPRTLEELLDMIETHFPNLTDETVAHVATMCLVSLDGGE